MRRFFNKSILNEEVDHQVFNRHKTTVSVHDFVPTIYHPPQVAPSAVIIGEVSVFEDTYIGNNSVLKGDLNFVSVFDRSIIMENCLLSTVSQLDKTGQQAVVSVGEYCLVQPGCILISTEVSDHVSIGPKSILCEGSKIGDNTVIGAHSVVPPYRYIPGNQLWAGNPVRYVKDLSKQEMTSLRVFKQNQIKAMAREGRDELRNNSSFLEKEILDDLEINMKNENLTIEDLESTLEMMRENGYEMYFQSQLVNVAKKRYQEMKGNKVNQIKESSV